MEQCYDKPIWTLQHLLRALPGLPARLRHMPRLGGALRERIMLAVAVENRCRYCQLAHTTFGRAAGLSADEVQAIVDDEELAQLQPGERAAVAYVRDLARRNFASPSPDLRRQLSMHFDEESVQAIEGAAHLMNLANRLGNTLDALLARLVRRGDRSGAGWADLALLSPLFMLGAAAVAPSVGALSLWHWLKGGA